MHVSDVIKEALNTDMLDCVSKTKDPCRMSGRLQKPRQTCWIAGTPAKLIKVVTLVITIMFY